MISVPTARKCIGGFGRGRFRYQKGPTLPAASRASLGDLNLMITFCLRLPPMHALLVW